ncbi:MAG: DUF4249 domain-containing protein [Bacteroidetes bacterium]|nr:DUF4249 domain-containing protein [Bacteroidota bacterium]
MNKIFLTLSALFFLLTSCEKVVNINLNNASPQYVVEGVVFDGTDTARVRLAKTTDYYGISPQQILTNATVSLSDDMGNSVVLPYIGWDSCYQLSGFTSISGRKYTIHVLVDGLNIQGSSTLQQSVPIDSVSIVYKTDGFRGAGYEVATNISDPANTPNFYRLVTTINDTLQNQPKDLYLFNDKYNDGKHIRTALKRRFKSGDKITIELRTMDAAVYDFFTSLRDALNNQNGPAPANPNTNLIGGALGYFGTFTRSKVSIIVP